MSGLGIAYLELRRVDEATQHQEAAAAIAREGNHRFPLARALSALGILAMARTDYDAAVSYFAECEQIAAEDEDPYGGMLAVFNAAFAYLELKDHDHAQAFFEKALPMGDALGATDVMAGCISALAHIMQANGQLEPALARFRESAALARDTSNLLGLAHANGNIAQTLAELGRPAEARSAFLAALEAAEQLGDPHLQAEFQSQVDRLHADQTIA